MGNLISTRVRYTIIFLTAVGIVRKDDVIRLFNKYLSQYFFNKEKTTIKNRKRNSSVTNDMKLSPVTSTKKKPSISSPKTEEKRKKTNKTNNNNKAKKKAKRKKKKSSNKNNNKKEKQDDHDKIFEEAWEESTKSIAIKNTALNNAEDNDVKPTFDKAVKYINDSDIDTSTEDQLNLYGLYKRATVGTCNIAQPGMFDGMEKKYKWDAWKARDSISTTYEAMSKYIDLVEKLSPNWNGDDKTNNDNNNNNNNNQNNSSENDKSATKTDSNTTTTTTTTTTTNNNNNKKKKTPKDTAAAMAKTQSTMKSLHFKLENEKINNDIFQYAQDGNLQLVKNGIRDGCNVNNVDKEMGMTCLMWACDRERMDVVKYLVEEAGADLAIQDPDGQSALHCALPYPDISYYLAKHGANINLKDIDGYTPLDVAKDSTSETDVEVLKKAYKEYQTKKDNEEQNKIKLLDIEPPE